MKKKFNGLLVLFVALALIFAGCSSDDGDGGSAYTNGWDGSTYNIVDAEGLFAWAEYMETENDYSVNATLRNSFYMGDDAWTPVGSESNQYTGTFDGNGYTVYNLKVSESDGGKQYGGLFSYVGSDGTVKNLGLSNVDVSISISNANAGAVAGQNNGTIEGCWSSGNIKSNASGTIRAGGIVGVNFAEITGCYSSADITSTGTGNVRAGGIAGANRGGGTITACYYVEGTVTAAGNAQQNRAGGIVGINYPYEDTADAYITACYSTGTIMATGTGSGSNPNCAGGIAGINDTDGKNNTHAYITASYWKGAITQGTETKEQGVGLGGDNGTDGSVQVDETSVVWSGTGDTVAMTEMNNQLSSDNVGWRYKASSSSTAPLTLSK